MLRLIFSGFAAMLMLCGCGTNETPTRHNDFTPLTSVEIVAVTPSIAASTSSGFSLIGNYSGQFTRDITAQALWSSSAPGVAAFVSPQNPNRVTGLAPGVATLTATVGNVSATFRLRVTPATVTALTITPATAAIAKGLSTQFTVQGKFSDATTQDLTFDAGWSSSRPTVATVGDAAGSKGVVQALNPGTSTISATFDGVSGSALLTVTAALLQSITVTPESPTLLSQSARSFQASGHYSDGSTADITSQVAWTSSHPAVATITTGGAAKTVAPGTTAISAALNGVSGVSNLKVTGGTLTGMVLSPVNLRLVRNTVAPIVATGTFSNGSSRDITGIIDWSVVSKNIAEVTAPATNQALLHALEVTAPATPARITAKSGLVTADINLTVSAPLLQSLMISPPSMDLLADTSGRLTAIATFNDGSTQDVTADTSWTSASETTATVEDEGLAKGRVKGINASNGRVTITAAYGDLTDTALVSVRSRDVTILTIVGNPVVAVGNQTGYTATATYGDASTRDVTADAVWTTDKPDFAAMVDNRQQPGQLVAVDSGAVTLSCAFGGRTQTLKLTIK